jgi:pyoverdine/dityrosine biosynthesis protein Dit1
MQPVEIRAGNMRQVHTALASGKLVAVGDDVQGVANDLAAIDPGLKLFYEPGEDVWIVKHVRQMPDGSEQEHLVSTFQQLDQRVVARIREISQPGYDYVGELDRLDAAAEREATHQFSEKIGPIGEKLAWAFRQDLGRHEHPSTRTARAVVPADIPKGD